jgi:hypothetical protein
VKEAAETVFLNLLTPRPLVTPADGRRVLQIWDECLPEYLPQVYSNSEPINNQFQMSNLDDVLRCWRWPFLAQRESPRVSAGVWMRRANQLQHASLRMSFVAQEVDAERLRNFIIRATQELSADFGCITLLSSHEIREGRLNGTTRPIDKGGSTFHFGVYSESLRNCLPDIYWLTVLGPPYVRMIGIDHVMRTPAHAVTEVDRESVLIQISPAIADVADGERFVASKNLIKRHLGSDLFFQHDRDGCRAPEFDFRS